MSSDNLKHKLETEIKPEDTKLELEDLQQKINKYEKDFYLKNEEIHKFLIAFQEIFEQINNKQETRFRRRNKRYNKNSRPRNYEFS